MSTTTSRLLASLCALAFALALGACVSPPVRPDLFGRPSIVIFIGDDHSVLDLGCYGSPVARTPNLDRLASEGLRFTRAFTPTAMCSPARSALYTGLYPHRNGCHMNHGAVHDGVQSLPHYLTKLGYRVALSGKVHVKPRASFPFEYIRFGKNRQLDFEAMEEFMTAGGPFCLVVASNEPHTPHARGGFDPDEVRLPPYIPPTPEARQYQADYLTDVELVDREVGRVLDSLERRDLAGNTMFLYAGDHGNGVFAKWTCYDMGIRVPFIIRWPDVVEPGRVTDAMVSFIDVLPTCIEIVGGRADPALDGRSFLGLLRGETDTHRDVIFAAHTTRGIISGSDYPIRAVRDERFKYIRNLNPGGVFQNIITQGRGGGEEEEEEEEDGVPRWRSWVDLARTDEVAAALVERYRRRPAEELYDLENDPFEMHNLATPKEAAKYRGVLEHLRALLDDWMASQGDDGMAAEMRVEERPARR